MLHRLFCGRARTCSRDVAVSVLTPPRFLGAMRGACGAQRVEDCRPQRAGRTRRGSERVNTITMNEEGLSSFYGGENSRARQSSLGLSRS